MTAFSIINVKVRDYTKENAVGWATRKELYHDQVRRPRIYFFHVGETIIDNLRNRRNRPQDEYRKLLPEVLERAGIPQECVAKIRWSQKAGCTCGCSPGFIVIDNENMRLRGRDVFVDVAESSC